MPTPFICIDLDQPIPPCCLLYNFAIGTSRHFAAPQNLVAIALTPSCSAFSVTSPDRRFCRAPLARSRRRAWPLRADCAGRADDLVAQHNRRAAAKEHEVRQLGEW